MAKKGNARLSLSHDFFRFLYDTRVVVHPRARFSRQRHEEAKLASRLHAAAARSPSLSRN